MRESFCKGNSASAIVHFTSSFEDSEKSDQYFVHRLSNSVSANDR